MEIKTAKPLSIEFRQSSLNQIYRHILVDFPIGRNLETVLEYPVVWPQSRLEFFNHIAAE